jgi:hypothetical protein
MFNLQRHSSVNENEKIKEIGNNLGQRLQIINIKKNR